jgi:hypothetical protein
MALSSTSTPTHWRPAAGHYNGTTEGVQIAIAPPSGEFPSGFGTRLYWVAEGSGYTQRSEALSAGTSTSSNGVQFVTVLTSKGYAIELRVPWTALGASVSPKKVGLGFGLGEATATTAAQPTSAGDIRLGIVEMYRRNPPLSVANCGATPFCNNSAWCPVDLLNLP